MKIERLLSIIILLLEKEIVSANTLAKQFEVTKRTIYRDIETLEFAGFPIISYPGKYGGFGFIDTFKMHRFTFNTQEKQKIIEALNLQEQVLSFQKNDTIVKTKLQSIRTKEEVIVPMNFSSVTLHHPRIEEQTNQKLEAIHTIIKNQYKMKITYITGQGEFSSRIICPLALKLENGSWYVEAFCELRKDIRLFKLTRIREIDIIKVTYDKRNIPTSTNFSSQQIEITLSFQKKALGKLYDFFLDEQMTIQEKEVLVTFPYQSTGNVIPFLLMFSKDVTVIQPSWLKEKHKEMIENMQLLYQ